MASGDVRVDLHTKHLCTLLDMAPSIFCFANNSLTVHKVDISPHHASFTEYFFTYRIFI